MSVVIPAPYTRPRVRPFTTGALAPVSPDYVRYLADRAAGRRRRETADGHPLGYAPPRLDLRVPPQVSIARRVPPRIYRRNRFYALTAWMPDHLRVIVNDLAGNYLLKYPRRYDLREQGRVTPVKMQDGATCWASACYGSLESSLLPAHSWDFSEKHMIHESGEGSDGNDFRALGYLTRWRGPVKESDYTWDGPADQPVQMHVQKVLMLPARETEGQPDPLANDWIKWAVTTRGAVSVAMDWENYDPVNHTHYIDAASASGQNHGVTIVGWDDDFDRHKFPPGASGVPPGNGAFIAKNSWGPDWGEQGYFYISYYDGGLAAFTSWTAESTADFLRVYAYDQMGMTDSFSMEMRGERVLTLGANLFSAEGIEDLTAIGYYTTWPNVHCAAAVYVDPINGPTHPSGPVAAGAALHQLAGYHTLRVSPRLPLQPGRKFSVVLAQWSQEIYGCQPQALGIERACPDTPTSAQPQQSFVTCDGVWHDLTSMTIEDHDTNVDLSLADANLCIKAFTRPHPSPSPAGVITAWSVWDTIGLLTDPLDQPPATNGVSVLSTTPRSGDMAPPEIDLAAAFDAPIVAGPGLSGVRLTSGTFTLPVECSIQGMILRIVPLSSLQGVPGSYGLDTWTVLIPHDAVTDARHRAMAGDYTWTFQTRSHIAVIHTVPNPDELVHPETTIVASFNAPIQTGPDFSGVRVTSGSLEMPVSCSLNGNDLHIVPAGKLGNTGQTLGHDHWTVLIPRNAVTDIYFTRGLMADYSWTFRTIVVN